MLIMLNCRNRHHAEIYRRYDAFFDLDMDRHQDEKGMLYENATCCVLSYVDVHDKSGKVTLSFWRYRDMFEHTGENAWVMVGERIGDLTCDKSELAKHPEFEGVIASDGDFNRFNIKHSR